MARRRSELAEPIVEDHQATTPEPTPKKPRDRRRTLWIVIGLLAAFVVYAYAYQTTQVNLDKISDQTRQQSLFRVIRALASPDLLTYETTDTAVDLEYMIPCPADGFEPAALEGGVSLSVDQSCADPRAQVVASGSGLVANVQVQLFFVPPNGTQLRLANVRTDSTGSFQETVRLPNRPDDQVQTIRLLSKAKVGSIFSPVYVTTDSGDRVRSPRWSVNAQATLDKIIETVLLALLATTAGTLIAIPLSFLAAKNLMRDVRIPGLQLALAVAAAPIGIALGLIASSGARWLVDQVPVGPEDSIELWGAILLGILTLGLAWLSVRLLRLAVPAPESTTSRAARASAAVTSAFVILLAGQGLSRFAILFGTWFERHAGPLSFLGNFVATNGEILAAAFGVIAALAGALILGLLGSKLGYWVGARVSAPVRSTLTILAAAVAGGILGWVAGQAIAWLYQIVNVRTTVVIPVAIGALLGAWIGWSGVRKGNVASGLGIYYISRTVFNTLRSIEPLIMAIVFVIWVGLGPFAGALALGLHTVVSLAKLYSEQVESINPGPVEAVRATGATRLQTIVYGVVPQIIPPYISFTMYRWDINVRMSTIIGFVGGGGIGFLLQQNISLLDYRAAATQVLAIAIVVASMDYASSRLRERFT
jgi:phosphonate ABC transporter permease subunit PhnE